MKKTTFSGELECEVCGDYAVVAIRDQFVCGVCFGIVATLTTKRSTPDHGDVRELISYLYVERGEPSSTEITNLLALVRANRTAPQPLAL
jgi:hypothetical protein